MPSENEESASPGNGGEHKPEQSYDNFFRVRPVAFLKHFYAESNQYEATEDKRNYYRDALRRVCHWISKSFLGKFIVVSIIVCLIAYGLYVSGLANSDRVIALFTVVLSIAAGIQLWTMRQENAHLLNQTRQMIVQNKVMAKQTDLAQGQLEQMRLAQRAWLGVVSPTIEPLEIEKPITCAVIIENSGKMPGTIDVVTAMPFPVMRGYDISNAVGQVIMTVSTQQRGERQIVLAPGSKTRLPIKGEVLTKDIADRLANNELDLYVIGRFLYSDGFSENHLTQFALLCESIEGKGGYQLVIYHQYNDMK